MKKKVFRVYLSFSIHCLVILGLVGCSGVKIKKIKIGFQKRAKVVRDSYQKKSGHVERRYKKLSEAYNKKSEADFIKEVRTSLSKNKKDLKALNLLAIYHLNKRRFGLARTIFARALGSHPRSSAIHNNLGVINLLEKKRKKAIKSFKKAINEDSNNFSAIMNLATIYIQNDSYEKAEKLLKRAYREKPKNLEVLTYYSLVLSETKDFSRAKKIYKKALSLGAGLENHINYAILLVDSMSDSKMGLVEIKKIKLKTLNSRQRKLLSNLEKRSLSGLKR